MLADFSPKMAYSQHFVHSGHLQSNLTILGGKVRLLNSKDFHEKI